MPYSIFQIFIISWIALAAGVFFYLLRNTAPYGRYSTVSWGPVISNRVGWIMMEAPALIIMLLYYVLYFEILEELVKWMMSLYALHYVNRSVVYPFRIKTKSKKMPLVIMISGMVFNVINANILGYYFSHYADYPADYGFYLSFNIGVLVFFAGLWINWKGDTKLLQLRSKERVGYTIPEGWLFRWISCPNYLGEVLEWLGFALMCSNLAVWSFFIWTIANLVPRAIQHHRWYKENFQQYPQQRKALLPFLI